MIGNYYAGSWWWMMMGLPMVVGLGYILFIIFLWNIMRSLARIAEGIEKLVNRSA